MQTKCSVLVLFGFGTTGPGPAHPTAPLGHAAFFVPSLRNERWWWQRGERERASSTMKAQERKENGAWGGPQQLSSSGLWGERARAGRLPRVHFPSGSSTFFPSRLSIKRREPGPLLFLQGADGPVGACGVCVAEETLAAEDSGPKTFGPFCWVESSTLFHTSLFIENSLSLKKDWRKRTVFDVNKLYEHKT